MPEISPDPLSPATRATKRNLMLAAIVAVSANAFDVSVEKIPLGGLEIKFDNRLFAFLLFLALTYFWVAFLLYYIIDVKNLETLPHQKDAEDRFSRSGILFNHDYRQKLMAALKSTLPKGYMVSIEDTFDHKLSLESIEVTEYITRANSSWSEPRTRETDPELFEKLDSIAEPLIARFPKAIRRHRMKAWTSVKLTRSMYKFRVFGLDGLLPITMGAFALVTIIGHINLSPIKLLMPTFSKAPSYYSGGSAPP